MEQIDQKQNRSFAGIYREEVNKYKGRVRLMLLFLLLNVNHSDNPDFIFDNRVFPLKRGQLVTSRKRLSEETGFSEQSTKTLLKNLENLEILTKSSTNELTNRASLITFVDIDKFIVAPKELTNYITGEVTNDQPTPNQPLTTNNNDNNEKKEKEGKNKYTKKYFLEHTQEILEEARSKYGDIKNVDKAMQVFCNQIEAKNYKYTNYKLAFFNWVREDRFNQFNLGVIKPVGTGKMKIDIN